MRPSSSGLRSAEVVGDGTAALVAAIALAKRGWSVNVRLPLRARPLTARVDVLAASARITLAKLGVSCADMLGVAHPCPGIWSSWGVGGAHELDCLATPYGPAWAVDKDAFESLLKERARDVGVSFSPADDAQLAVRNDSSPKHQRTDASWRIVASGRFTRPSTPSPYTHDDNLIALVCLADFPQSQALDARLMIEAAPDGWAYAVAGPQRRVCFGLITDSQSFAGAKPRDFATELFNRTTRIAFLWRGPHSRSDIHATPLPCRRLPIMAGERSIRIGDAQASHDPLSGRGLWEAIRKADTAATALSQNPIEIDQLEQASQREYCAYLRRRMEFYYAGYSRFGTGFWARRCNAGSDPRKVSGFEDLSA